jgi:fibronectin type 3 domain-containing protein
MACVFAFALVQLVGGSRAAGPTPDQVGQWSAPTSWPLVAVNMSLEPTGQVLTWDGWDAAPASMRLFDPSSGSFIGVPYGRNLFCAGNTQLPDGRTLIAGGHISSDLGSADTTIFDPISKTYFRGPDMTVGRWYPTVTQLADGRSLVFSGDNIVQDRPSQPHPFEDASVNSLPEIYNYKTNTWTDLTSATLTSPLYPFMFLLSNGKVFDAGPDTVTRTLDPSTGTWTTVGTSPFDGMSAVMYRPDKIMKAGTWADPDFNGSKVYNADGRTAVIDMGAANPSWRSTASMAFGRAYQNLTMLADGTVLASGGMSTSDGTDLSKAVLPAEIWNPDTETWTTVASLTNGREYHSTALLLPDGRVLMAGGGALPGRAVDQTNAEIYSPPYLFKGARPTITSAPGGASWGSNFDITTPDAASITKVSLVRSPSVTHAFDQNQRFQFLNFTAGSGKITVQAPASATQAPPGDYMLFILNGNGVPSVGSFIRLSTTGDITPPPAPTSLVANASSGQVSLTWNGSSDPSGIANYNVYRSTTPGFTPSAANRIAQPSSTSYTDLGRTAGTYYYKVTADDTAGNTSAPSNEVTAVVPNGPLPGLVAAYGFDEGSGTTSADQSGNGNGATLANTTWSSSGKFGKALSFNGTNAWATVNSSNSLALTTGMTVEAWVNPTTLGNAYRTVVFREQTGNEVYSLYGNRSGSPQAPVGEVYVNGYKDASASTGLATGTWTHLAETYDGASVRLYVNGSLISTTAAPGSLASSNSPLRIGGNGIWGEYFSGLIDEVRVYNRALSAAEIQQDMNTAISNPDAVPPSAPGTLTATGGLGQISLSWGAATDNVGVLRYNVYRSTTSGFTPSAANRIAQPTGTNYTDSGLATGTYYYRVIAEDGAGNLGSPSNEANAAATADTTAPTAPGGLGASAVGNTVNLSWNAATDNVGVARYNVHRSATPGFTPSAANRVAQPTGTSYADTGLAPGTYYYKVTAEDAAGNVSGPSSEVNATVAASSGAGLVAAYSFDAGSGTTAVDSSGNGNTGTLSNATWATSGKYGSALSFNGTNAWVTVNSSSSLALTTGMTVEAWVNPTTLGSAYRTVVFREQPGNEVYSLYANQSNPQAPLGEVYVSGYKDASASTGLAAGTWAHLAETYDGSSVRLYVNGTLISTTAAPGSLASSSLPLRIGGNNIWGEYFSGLIDEVRVYNRALSASEIQLDMNTSISPSDAQAPTAPGSLTANGSLTSASLNWTASTDNVGVVRYNVYRSTTSGFTPSAANRIAQPTGTSFTDTGLAAGTYYYKVTAEDAAGNLSAPSNEASALVGDMTPPSAPGTLSANGGVGTAALSWGTATDNVGVVRYDVYRSTTSGFTPSAANRIAQPTGTSYTDSPLSLGTYYYKVAAEDAAGNVGPPSNEASATATADATPPTAPANLAASVVGGTVNLTWTGSTDNVGVVRYDVYRDTTQGFTPSAANRIAQPTGTTYSDSSIFALGTYYYKVLAEDAAGNLSQPSNEASAAIADTTPPSTPGGLAGTVNGSSVALSWTASTDNVGVVRYNVHRSTTSGFTPSAANRIAQPTGTSYTDAGLAVGTYFYKVTAEDAAGNLSAPSAQASATIPDTTVPSTPTNLNATGGAGQAALTWTAATDNVGVVRYNVHRSTTSGFTPSTANRIAQPTGTSYTDTGLAAGTFFYKVTAEDAAGNVSTPSAQASATVTNPAPTGLVAGYGFDEGSGTTTADRSGNGNTGTLSNATWSTAGKFGNALFFNGTNARVNINDSNSLDLTNGMTLEAWVKPTVANTVFQTILMKEQPGNTAYALYGNTDTGRPDTEGVVGGSYKTLLAPSALATGTWSYLTATYDGSTLRLFLNGTQVAQQAVSGSIATSTSALRIGGNVVWGGEWFNGWIDEVRIYNRALSAAEIQNDMFTSVTPDTTPPTITAKNPAAGSAGINVGTPVTATFNEVLRSSTMTGSNFFLKDPGGNVVPATVSYDSTTNVATLTP